jgi:transposase
MTRSVRKYTSEFKQEAVNLAFKLPSISQAAEEPGVPVGTFHSWINQLKIVSKMAKDGQDNKAQDINALVKENRRLHKELTIVKEEKEILKKAATYFACHQK